MAGLLKAVPQNFAYGLSALIDAQGRRRRRAEAEADEAAETPAGVEEAAPAASDDAATPVAEVAAEARPPRPSPNTDSEASSRRRGRTGRITQPRSKKRKESPWLQP